MRIFLICFLLALLPLAALGHDIYLAYEEHEMDILGQPFEFTDLGIVWTRYAPASFNLFRESIDPETWKSVYDPILRQSAVLVAAVPALIVYALLIIAKIFGIWPFAEAGLIGRPKKRKDFSYGDIGKKPKGAVKYKRK